MPMTMSPKRGFSAAEARTWLGGGPEGRRRPAIRPYPGNWRRQVKLRGGLGFSVRPIRPEDEEAIGAMLQKVTQEDLRLRAAASLYQIAPREPLAHSDAAWFADLGVAHPHFARHGGSGAHFGALLGVGGQDMSGQGRGKEAEAIARQLRGTDHKCREVPSAVATRK